MGLCCCKERKNMEDQANSPEPIMFKSKNDYSTYGMESEPNYKTEERFNKGGFDTFGVNLGNNVSNEVFLGDGHVNYRLFNIIF